MMRVIGLYQDQETARKVLSQLDQKGIHEDEVELIAQDQQDLAGHISEFGISEKSAQIYAEAVRHGMAMLSAEAEDEQAEEILDLMDENGALDVDEVAPQLKGKEAGSKETIRQVEEDLSIGKRKVLQGGKRISTKVREQPVEKKVTLREEKIDIEEHPSDRKLSPEEAESAFKEETREFTETREVPEVKKEARETGVVEVSRSGSEREETVKDTVRKSEVRTEEIKPSKEK